MTLEQLLAVANNLGSATAPVFFIMWYLERKDKQRLLRILLSYLPAMEGQARVMRGVSKVLGADDE